MSGVAGFINFEGRSADKALLQRMTSAMDYRGPDGIGTWCVGAAALSHCALVTTSEQLRETQPLQDVSGELVLVFDGRVDNRPELRRELAAGGLRLRDDSDAELVLRAYEHWKDDCVAHIEGEFALVVWNARTASAFCARDRMGIRPFHYHWDGTTLTFASDVHAVLGVPWVPERLNLGMVAEAIAVEHLSRHETFWQGVLRLPAATAAVFSKCEVKLRCYWQPDRSFQLPCSSDADYVAYYGDLLEDVVRRQSRSHQPIACEVSGGLDSSALFAVGRRLVRDQQLQAPALLGFALGFSDELADESVYRKALSEHFGTTIEEVEPGRYPIGWYQQYGAAYRDFAGFPNWTMMRPLYAAARSRGCSVVLNGTGGDEWLGAVRDPPSLRNRLRGLISLVFPESCMQWVRRRRGVPEPSAWLSPEMVRTLRDRRRRLGSNRPHTSELLWPLQWALLTDADGQFGREMSERQAAMCGIERRQPFWDKRIVEASFATPEWLRARNGQDKWLHRRAMEGLLPPAILAREDKANFLVMAKQQRAELTAALQHTLAVRSSWVRTDRIKPAAEYVDRASLADFAQWALLMADALEPRMCPARPAL